MAVAEDHEHMLGRESVDPDDEALRSWEQFREAAALLYGQIDTALHARHALSILDVHVLHRLNTDPSRCLRMGALAESLALMPSRVTGLVSRLESRNLVRRIRSRADRRIVIVGITHKGQDYLQPALRTYSTLIRRHYLTPLTRDQMTALGDCTRRVSDALKLRDGPSGS